MTDSKKRRVTSYDDVVGSQHRSQLRKRYDLGGSSSGATSPNLKDTVRPPAPPADETRNETRRDEHSRPTIPTPPPRLALGAIPRRLVDDRALMALPLDHRAAFVLMHIDGKTPLRTLVDVTGMLPEEVVSLVERLLELDAVTIL